MSYKLVNTGPKGIEDNFWELNPHLRYLSPFKELYAKDKSSKKADSSKDMWCIWMLEDPSLDNKVFHFTKERQAEIVKNYNSKFAEDRKEIQAIREVYDDFCLSIAGRAYKEESATMADRTAFLRNAKYTFDYYEQDPKTGKTKIVKGNATEIDAMRLRTIKINESYKQVERMFEEEQRVARIYGGRAQTIREMRLLNPDIDDDDD